MYLLHKGKSLGKEIGCFVEYLHKQHLSSHVLVLAHDGMQKSQFKLNSHLSIVSPILQFYARLCHIFLDLEEDLLLYICF